MRGQRDVSQSPCLLPRSRYMQEQICVAALCSTERVLLYSKLARSVARWITTTAMCPMKRLPVLHFASPKKVEATCDFETISCILKS